MRFNRFYMRPGSNRFSRDPEESACWLRLGDAAIPALKLAAHAYDLREKCESPIEVMLGAQINALLEQLNAYDVSLIPQYRLGRYRYDFALKMEDLPDPSVLIECDGAEFHSTPEQIENDKRKDAAAQQAGMRLLRFSGSEINGDADGCASVALGELIQRIR